MTIRIMLVDDQELIRTGFKMVLSAQPDIEVVAEASNGHQAVQQVKQTNLDVVLMDVRMPGMDGVAATREICRQRRDATPKVLILTTFDLDEYAFAALKAGASGFLLKEASAAELVGAIRAVHSGDAVVAPSTTRRLIDRFTSYLPDTGVASAADGLEQLTSREREVLLLLAGGLSNAEIAQQLVLSEATVKTHLGRVLAKLGLRDRVQAVVYAYENGLVGR
ncbi:response regulator transcription factor [Flindersiella endophytica]